MARCLIRVIGSGGAAKGVGRGRPAAKLFFVEAKTKYFAGVFNKRTNSTK
jgi:hypothetical protein